MKRATRWVEQEFEGAHFKDERLRSRVIRLVDRFSEAPECPINQACLDWAETKAAYRFFRNEKVDASEILSAHVDKTVRRAKQCQTVLAIQDTSYFNYSSHSKTSGLGIISRKKGVHVKNILGKGLIMHTAFAVTLEGLPLGILDQKIVARQPLPKAIWERKKKSHNMALPVEEKESFKWIEALIRSNYHLAESKTKMITVCDREADMYDFFECAFKLDASILVRSRGDRIVNRTSKRSEKPKKRLWNFVKRQPIRGRLHVQIPSRGGRFGNYPRSAVLDLRFGSFTMTPPRYHKNYWELPRFKINAIHVVERDPPKTEEAIEWVLLTNLPVRNFDEAAEKVHWYSFRFRIETLHRVLKSGFLVEQCRLGTAASLIRYLTVMSIAAWRIFWITIIGRSNPDSLCTLFLTDAEWRVLYSKVYQTYQIPKEPISTHAAIHLIARLGGFLDRSLDHEPGVVAIWRGWRRLADLSDGWNLAIESMAHGQRRKIMGNS